VKIGQVDVDRIGLTKITAKIIKKKTSAKHKPSSPRFAQSGWINYDSLLENLEKSR